MLFKEGNLLIAQVQMSELNIIFITFVLFVVAFLVIFFAIFMWKMFNRLAPNLQPQIISEPKVISQPEPQKIIVDNQSNEKETAEDTALRLKYEVAWGKLTTREKQITRQISDGRTNIKIADSLGIAEKTVRKHNTGIFLKFNCSNRQELQFIVHTYKLDGKV